MKNNYKTELKNMPTNKLKNWISRKTENLLTGHFDNFGSTPLLNKITYAKKLLAKRESQEA